MIRKTFENDMQLLKNEIMALGTMVANSLLNSVEALRTRDFETAKQIIETDKQINERRFTLENQTMIMIATQQPMAHDLRLLASVLEVISELERMGDYAKGISIINLRMGDDTLLKPLIDIPLMSKKAADMLQQALTAFLNEDAQLARRIPAADDEVDNLYNQVYRELMTHIVADPKNIERANWLLWVAHNIERFADRVTNICERTIFIVTGDNREINEIKDG